MAVAISLGGDTTGVAASGNVAVYSGVGIGTAAADRLVVLAVSSVLANSGATQATIDGVPMLAGTQGNQGTLFSRLFWLPWPTGTTAEFRVTFGSTNPTEVQNHVAAYRVVGGTRPTTQNVVNDTDADPITTGAVTVPANGGILCVDAHATEGTARTWTGSTESLDESSGTGGFRFSTGFLNSAAGGNITTTVSGANQEDATLAYAVFTAGLPGQLASVAYAGSGNAAIASQQVLSAFADFTGTGELLVDATIQEALAPLVGTAAFIGASNLLAATGQFTAGKYDETGEIASLSLSGDAFTEFEFGLKIDYNSVITGDVLRFRVYANGVALDQYSVTPSITIAAHAIPASAALSGIGNLSALARMRLVPVANFSGSGALDATARMFLRPTAIMQGAGALLETPQLLMRGFAAFAGVGAISFNASVLKFANLAFSATGNQSAIAKLLMQSNALLSGVGNFSIAASINKFAVLAFNATGAFSIGTSHFSAGRYDETGAVNLNLSPDAWSELEFGLKLDLDNVQTGDVLRFRVYSNSNPLDQYFVTPSITVAAHAINATAIFAGLGNLTVDAAISVTGQTLQGSAAFSGTGAFGITGKLLMSATAQFIAGGTMSVTAITRLSPTAAFAGAGSETTTAVLRMVASSLLAGVGSLAVEANMLGAVTQWSGAATFQGIGDLAATPVLLMNAAETLASVGAQVASATLQMSSSAAFAGTGSLSVSIGSATIGSSAEYSGAGNILATPFLRMLAAATFYSGVGSLLVDASVLGQLVGSVNYLGLGNMAITPRLRMIAAASYQATGNFDISPVLRMRGLITAMRGLGSLLANANMTVRRNATFAGTGAFLSSAQIFRFLFANYAGAGNMTATARMRLQPTANYSGLGEMSITPRLRMAEFINFVGSGLMRVDLTFKAQQLAAAVNFTGSSNLAAIAKLRMRSSPAFSATGSLNADAIRFINLSEQMFAGTGYFSAQVQLTMAAMAEFRAIGLMRATTFMLHEPLGITICDLGAAFATADLGLTIATCALDTETSYATVDTEIGCH